MIITDDFVYIHYPKTGGTFVTKVLQELYQYKKRYRYLGTLLPKIIRSKVLQYAEIRYRVQGFNYRNVHGTCREIPQEHRDKPILATIRNPYDRYVSHYEFGWWKTHAEEEFEFYTVKEIKDKYPNFPDLDFEEYLNLWNATWLPEKMKKINFQSNESFGIETLDFIQFFFKNPQEVLAKFLYDPHGYISSQRYTADMFNVHFIRTDRLNEELYDFLLNMGWNRNEVAFVLNLEKILPKEGGRSKVQIWEKYYTRELKSIIRRKERLIFDIFPQFDV